jgi:2-oxoglutarate ferredoxin oxidoreductase subunit alpha
VRSRILLKNIMYAGFLGALLDIDMDIMRAMLGESYASKKSLLDANVKALEIGYNYAKEHCQCPLPLRVARMDQDVESHHDRRQHCRRARLLVRGRNGRRVVSDHAVDVADGRVQELLPEVARRSADRRAQLRHRPVRGRTGGDRRCDRRDVERCRAFTPTSGPGISLMNEFIGLAYYAEVPAVIFDIQRVGPSTGMPTRTQQGDLMLAAYASHGDTRHVLLFPADPEECFYMAVQSFDLAERLQTPVFVMSDLDIGMNDWMCPALKWDDSYQPDRGKVLTKAEIERLDKFHRYLDKDDDAIPYRTLPGVHPKGAYFTRGSGHTQYGGYTEDAAEYQVVLDRLKRKFDRAKTLVPKAVFTGKNSHDVGIVSLGSCDGAMREALDILKRRGAQLDYMRVRSFPFGQEVEEFLASHSLLFVVEQNRDAQLKSLLTLETKVDKAKLRSILHYSGLPISSSVIVDGVLAELGESLTKPLSAIR